MPFSPTPPKVQLARGDPRKRGRRKLEALAAAEPQVVRGLPACPARLKGEARKAWGIWAAALECMEMDYASVAPMLEGACVAVADAIAAEKQIAREGQTVTTSRGDIRPHPCNDIARKAREQVRRLCVELGLTPTGRARLTNAGQPAAAPEHDKFHELLAAPRPQRFQ